MDTTEVPTDRRPRRLLAWSLVVVAATSALMLLTEPRLGIVWDEGYTLGRETRIRLWFRALRDPRAFARTWIPPAPNTELVQPDAIPLPAPRADQVDTLAKLFEPKVLAWFWPFAREEPHGHPPFYAILGLAGDVFAPWLPDLPRARLGPILAYSLTCGAIFLFMARRWGPWSGILASGAWVFQPNLFGHAHYAAYDAPLTCLWVGAILAFAKSIEVGNERRGPRWGWAAVFGILCGWAADTKLTGWFLPLPFIVWALIYRDRRAFLTLLAGALAGLATLYLFNPGWWSAPISGIERFLRSNLTRGKTIPIEVLFLGKVYRTPNESLPIYNTLVWTFFVTPVGFLVLGMVGIGRALRRWKVEPFGLLVLGHWAFLMLLRSLPHTPGHDGVRLFLPAFGVLSLLVGLGGASVIALRPWARGVAGLCLAEAVIGTLMMLPVPLSYFSPAVGGLKGATALGMEPTYYWDGLTDEAIDWLNEHTPPGRKVLFNSNPTSWLYLRRTGRLKPSFHPMDPGAWAWYVVQNRPGSMSPVDREIVAKLKPAFTVEKFGVALVWVFAYPFGS